MKSKLSFLKHISIPIIILIVILGVMIYEDHSSNSFKVDDKFVHVKYVGIENENLVNFDVLKDKETGMLYLWDVQHGGLTVWLDKDGKPRKDI